MKVLLWLALLAIGASVQLAGASIEGVVVDTITGTGIPGTQVWLWIVNYADYSTVTDPAGAFHIDNLKPGVYFVQVEKPGLFVLLPKSLRVDSSSGAVPIQLHYDVEFRRKPSPVQEIARPGGVVEGVVLNRATGAGIDGASVTLFTHQASTFPDTLHRALTDSSGSFRMQGISQGKYSVLLEKDGIVDYPKEPLEVQSGDPVRIQCMMQIGQTSQGSLTGRVLDSHDQPAAFAQMDLIRGPALHFRTGADADGRFVFRGLDLGGYTLRATPTRFSKDAVQEIATYFPSSMDARDAQRIVIGGDAIAGDFRLQTAPVFRVRGVVLAESGRLAAHTAVRLVQIAQQPAHVVASFDSYFTTVKEGPAGEPDEASVMTGEDGIFEFPAVRKGEWRIVAESLSLNQTGIVAVAITDQDVLNVRMQLEPTFGRVASAYWNDQERRIGVFAGAATTGASEGVVYPFWLAGVDGQGGTLNLSMVQRDVQETCLLSHIPCTWLLFDGLLPGRSIIRPLPAILNDGRAADAFVYGTLQGGANLLTQPVDPEHVALGRINSGSLGLLQDGRETVFQVGARGSVEGGNGAAVVFLPEQYAGEAGVLGTLVFCRQDGSFDAPSLFPGTYYVGAFHGLDFESLRDPELIERLVSLGNKVNIGSSTVLNLKTTPWPE